MLLFSSFELIILLVLVLYQCLIRLLSFKQKNKYSNAKTLQKRKHTRRTIRKNRKASCNQRLRIRQRIRRSKRRNQRITQKKQTLAVVVLVFLFFGSFAIFRGIPFIHNTWYPLPYPRHDLENRCKKEVYTASIRTVSAIFV